jgi:threonylcarbamoyladenosine tRNA methylthiotransferase MtaB
VANVDGVVRVRISSIESNHVNRRMVAAMAAEPKVCPHLHVPLQSGDDAVLGEMGRHYDSRRYARAIAAARAELPGLNLTPDVIVGYPSEDDASFERTLEFAGQLGFTKVHAFPFSERPGTAATEHRDPIAREVKAERSRRLREQADRIAVLHRTRLVGELDEVMVESRGVAGYGAGAGVLLTDDHVAVGGRGPVHTGYTRDYSPVRFVDLPDHVDDGDLLAVRLESLDEATGTLVARYEATLGGYQRPHG